jgi:hypothetical protein
MNKNSTYSTRAGAFRLRELAPHRVPASAQSVYGSIFGTVTDSTGRSDSRRHGHSKGRGQGHRRYRHLQRIGRLQRPPPYPRRLRPQGHSQGFQGHLRPRASQSRPIPLPVSIPPSKLAANTETVEVNAESQPELKTDRADVSHRLRPAAGFEPAGRRPELHQPATVAARRPASGLVSRGR